VGIETPGEGVVHSIVDGMRAVLDAEQLEDLKRHTRRGMRGRIQAGLSAGGLTYGYAPGQDKGKLVLVEHEAAVVRRIFAEYVHSRSPTSTAAPASKAPCWARRSSAGGSPAAGPPMQRATVAAFPASRTAVELGSHPGP
jgi:site-specific DNA recombinase